MTRNDDLSRLRRGRSELENHHIDELTAGRVSRREFLRRGSVIGLSAPTLAAVLAACGANSTSPAASGSAKPKRGGTIRVACPAPAAAINPITVADAGGLAMLQQTGEFLAVNNMQKLMLEPVLATSWKPNQDATVWTFALRPGVTFSDGSPMTADDVVYTFQQQSDPKNASNALSTFHGVLLPDGVRKVDSHTVAFHLEAAVGSFPYLVSSDNYNAIIVKRGTEFAKWQGNFLGTGPFKLSHYAVNVDASFVPNPHYWGPKPLLASTQFKFYSSQEPQILALQGGEVDIVAQFVTTGASSLLHSDSYKVLKLKSSSHRELSMRNDLPPFTDPRVRQAVAYSLDRTGMVSALLYGYGGVGNDSPFFPNFRSRDNSVPQRTQNISKAKQLLAAAGHANGFSTTLYTEQFEEIPELAQVIKADASKAGITINLNIETTSQYYGKATYGNSDWLDGQMSLVDYANRGVPDVFLEATLTSGGPWNAARFRNKTYDKLVKQFVAAIDLQTQRRLAGDIERLLLEQTPLIIPYWYNVLTATTPHVGGVLPSATDAQVFLGRAYTT